MLDICTNDALLLSLHCFNRCFAVVITLFESLHCCSHYLIIASDHVVRGSTYSVGVSVHNVDEPVDVEVRIDMLNTRNGPTSLDTVVETTRSLSGSGRQEALGCRSHSTYGFFIIEIISFSLINIMTFKFNYCI